MAKKLKWLIPVIAVLSVAFLAIGAKVLLFSPAKGSLHLECRKAIDLKIDGTGYGSGSTFDIDLVGGSYQYEGTIRGLANQNMTLAGTFTIEVGKTTNVVCGADPEVEFISEPKGARVTIQADQVPSLGSTPVKASLPPGTYTFVFNLSGRAIEKGPITLNFDDRKKIQALFDLPDKSKSKGIDRLRIDSSPEGLMVYDGKTLVGITPVSFDINKPMTVKGDGMDIQVPVVFDKQFVWIHPSNTMYMAISESKIEYSNRQWFVNGGFFKAYIENGFVRIDLEGGSTVQTKLPSHDWTIGFGIHGSQLVWVGAKGSQLLIEAFDQMTAKREDPKQKDQILYSFVKHIQSPSGNSIRFFVSQDTSMFELDISQMEAIDIGKNITGTIIRRMGETSDFGIGLFAADGKCAGIIGRRYQWYPEQPMNVGFVRSTQPPVMLFYSGTKLIGINTDSGAVEWESYIEENPLQVIWNENEHVWIAESMDSSRYYMIGQNDGQITPLDKGSSMAQENPNPGYYIAGYHTDTDRYMHLSVKPGQELVAKNDGGEIWKISCEAVFSTKAFNPLTDVGDIYIIKQGKLYNVNLADAHLTHIDAQPLEFFEIGALLCNDGVWSGNKKVFYGSCSANEAGNALKICLQDGSACVILP